VDCKHKRLIGQHSRFLPVSRGARTTSTVSLRPISAVRNPQQTGERHLTSTRDPPSTGLPNSQDRQSALPFAGHAELLQAISAPRAGTLGTTSRRSLRLQNQRNSLRYLNAGTSQGLQTVQGELVTRHSTGTPRPIHASCTRHRRPHVRHGCRAATTRPERLAAFVHKKPNPTGKITATPLPLTSTSQSTQHHTATGRRKNYALRTPSTLPRSLQQLSNNLRGGGGVMWEPPTLIQPPTNPSLGDVLC
jgi:hypothetical protein